ncbi:hypothetical protein RD792_012487 [Penstemon davidsonii]|uniref:Uncharacterized protein n=1 Tax=Penstemon davidsonii TaxID=160366 RepID=A0ABR0CXW5_9LAMI|nr:hypothetical protein RD792_012487 [Penstemon davidsonii]
MKFGKEFASQMVPEWHEAYLDYKFLKTLLKELQLFKHKNKPAVPKQHPHGLMRNLSLYRSFSGLTHLRRSPSHHHTEPDVENQVIHVNTVRRDGGEGSETTFLMTADEGGEYELVYFKRLDDEFNKVLKFYRSKVNEILDEAGVLNKQMEALIAFRVKVENPKGWVHNLEDTTKLASDLSNSIAALSATTPSAARASSKRVHMDVIDEDQSLRIGRRTNDENSDIGKEMEIINSDQIKEEHIHMDQSQKIERRAKRPASVEILNNVKLHTSLETPRSTIKGVLNIPNRTDLSFSKDNLKKAEEKLKTAFVVFYHKLRLLKSYSFLNILAVSKIMKKYDKIASRSASKSYMKMVDNSYLGSSDEVSRLMERVEATFIKHFSNSNRSKGMNILRPKSKREKHRVTFSMGFVVGCTVSLILALTLVIRARHILDNEGGDLYMSTMFPLYSLFGFIVLHMLLYAGNIYFWRRYRVNYSFIFGFKQGTELGYREVLFLAFCLSVLALACILANLDMEMDPVTKDYQTLTELLPAVLVLLVVAITLCPFNIVYRSSRFFLLSCLFRAILAPLYTVTLPDFFLADQISSQVQALRSLEFYICYYGWGDFRHRLNNCSSTDVFSTFSFIVAAVPFWWRLMQCLRRMFEEKDIWQGFNGLKYFLFMVAICIRTAYTLNGAVGWEYTAWIFSFIVIIFCSYWDIVIDWGLLQKNSRNRFLRDKLLVPYKSVYFVAMVMNVVLRVAWLQTVMNFTIFSLHRQAMIALVASLEIIRRGVWNFFRLENEHLNNVGKFRAFKSVPMPFNYDEDDEDKDE